MAGVALRSKTKKLSQYSDQAVATSSKAQNQAGEAENSHQKARKEGRDFWTFISKTGLKVEKLKSESPATNSWFDWPRYWDANVRTGMASEAT